MNLIVHEGRVGRADYRYPYLGMDRFTDPKLWNKYLQVCLSHATWFVESENERAVDELRDGSPECKYQSWRPKNGPYSVENFPKTEVVRQWATSIDSPLWYDSFGDMKVDAVYRTVLRFKQEPNKIEVVADFGKEWYLKGLKDGMESIKQEPKEEPTPTGSQVKWEPKIINEFLDASQFKGNDRINHFLLQAIRQLDTDEIRSLIDGLYGYVPKEEPNPSTSFFKFVQNQHPDPDHLMSKSVESAWPEICKLADKYREEPKTGESQAEVRDTLIDFVNWFSKLKPSDKCTVHPPAGSGGSTGLYNLTNAAIVDKFLTRKQTEQ